MKSFKQMRFKNKRVFLRCDAQQFFAKFLAPSEQVLLGFNVGDLL
jgi:hypothetical protein